MHCLGFVLRAIVRKYAEVLEIEPDVALELLSRETGNKVKNSVSKNLVSSLDFRDVRQLLLLRLRPEVFP
ncbi:hypothetical protein OURE66S_01513 [Oligella ureolytica]